MNQFPPTTLLPIDHLKRTRRPMVSLAIGAFFATAVPLLAINSPIISDFNGEMEPNPLEGGGESYGFMEGNNLGGLLDVKVLGGGLSEADGDALNCDGQGDPAAQFVITWDGEDESEDLDPEGLGGANLTVEEDGFTDQDAFLLTFGGTEVGGSLQIEVFTEEGEASSYSQVFTSSDDTILIPFAAFATSEGGGADFTSAGAIRLTLSGDLLTSIDQFETAAALSGVTMTDTVQIDGDMDGNADPGDTIRYTVTIPAAASATDVIVTHSLDVNTTLVTGSVNTSAGSVTTGNVIGDTTVTVDVGNLTGAAVVISFDVTVNPQPLVGSPPVCAQATVSRTGGADVLSDDPDDPGGSADQTCTAIELDLTPPVLTVPPDVAIAADDDSSPANTGTATATDNVTANPAVGFSDSLINGPAPFESRIERTWTATDDAGNSSSDLQVIELVDIIDRSLALSRPTYGVFSPIGQPGKRQAGEIGLDGIVNLLGTDNSLDAGNINSGAGLTTYDPAEGTEFFLGQTASDGLSRIFSIDVADGSSTSAVLSAGAFNTAVGIWWNEETNILFAIFSVSSPSAAWQLATIDPVSGTVTFIGSPSVGITGVIPGTLTGSYVNDQLYFLGTTGGLPGSIVSVELASGLMTPSTLIGANYNAISGMVFSEGAGTLYALVFQGAERRLASVDPTTGNVSLLGDTNIGGGIPILTYTGVNTIDEDTGTFIFIGRYNNGTENVWALFGVDIATGVSTFTDIDLTSVTTTGFHGLEYGRAVTLRGGIVATGFIGSNYYIDIAQATAGLKVTSSDDLVSPWEDVPGTIETVDDSGKPNRFLIPPGSRNLVRDFFRIEPE